MHTEEFKLGKGRLKNFDWKESTEIETNKKDYPLILTTSRVLQHYNAATMTRRTSNINIVDTVTNIKTVKLFAHDDHEDRAALEAMWGFRKSSLDYGVVAAWFRFCLNGLAGILPVMMVGGSLWFWSSGTVTAGDIAAAGAISLRLSQMTGWVSYTLMTLYSNLGEVEDGMKTLSPPHNLKDKADARTLKVVSGEIKFNQIHFSLKFKKSQYA